MKQMLEAEAKKVLLEQGGEYLGPKIALHKDHQQNTKV